MTIRDVAKASGVSVATVSYVLNNGPRPVNALTREHVLGVISRMNYRPDATAQRLSGRKMRTIGVHFGNIEADILTNPFAATVLQGIVSAASRARYNVTLFTTPWEDAGTSAVEFRDGRTDGVLVIAPVTDSDVVSGLAALDIPVVCVASPSCVPCVPFVEVNNRRGAEMATEYLLALGHTRIAFLGGDRNHSDAVARRDTFLATMDAAGVSVPTEHVPEGTYYWPRAVDNIRRLLTSANRPTALFAGNDTLAILAMEMARSLGLTIPGDLSVVGFDDLPNAALVSPPLTTVRQPLTQIGAVATETLIRIIEGDTSVQGADSEEMPMCRYLDAELVVRASCRLIV